MGRQPIHFALYRTKDHIEVLREHGANLFAADKMESSALHFAVVSGRLDVVQYILKEGQGRDLGRDLVNAKDIDG